jgi:preprotein translocase subunit SecF
METEGNIEIKQAAAPAVHTAPAEKKPFNLSHWYDKSYKILLILPLLVLILSLIYMVSFTMQTGDIIRKDVSLTGGTTLTIYSESLSISDIEISLKESYDDIVVRKLTDFTTGKQLAITIESKAQPEELKEAVEKIVGYDLDDVNSSVEFTGESLSKSFYKELILAMALAFLFMSIVIFIIFKVPLPSLYVILCAFMDIIVPMTVVNMMGLSLSTAGIAAFLMLIGYSVDTDILLTMRVLKRKEEALNLRMFGAFKTGMMMTATSLTAVTIGYFLTISPVLKEIFFILMIGLITDVFATWLMNGSMLKWYCDKRGIN